MRPPRPAGSKGTVVKRIVALAFVAVLVVGVLGIAGCSAKDSAEEKSMGVWGYVASEKSAQLEVADSQPGGEVVVVDRVLAPEDAWIVVHLDDNGKPGMRVGLVHIAKGESLAVEVPLEDVTSDKVIVAVHADRGTADEFDFAMENAETSPDRPFFVSEKELARVVSVR